MAQEVTLGGERLGSGNSMKQELHNYGMNSFNQGRDWKSTCAPGILYPCFKEIGTNFGTFDIDIDTFVRTLPTKGPLFGSFKMQVDLFNVPFRLYQGILHNNPVDIGLNMHQVKLPKLRIKTKEGKGAKQVKGSNDYSRQIHESSLEKYLGISGIGTFSNGKVTNTSIWRDIQCVPELGYYDIFKNYYSNKQEENAYVITPGDIEVVEPKNLKCYQELVDIAGNPVLVETTSSNWPIANVPDEQIYTFYFEGEDFEDIEEQIKLNFTAYPSGDNILSTIKYFKENEYITTNKINNNKIKITIKGESLKNLFDEIQGDNDTNIVMTFELNTSYEPNKYTANIELTPFALKNIDKMRSMLLACNELNQTFNIRSGGQTEPGLWSDDAGVDGTGMPYIALAKTTDDGITWNAFAQNGLVVKTYQSDLFNNWLDTSFVDTIASRTKIDTTSGGFTPDTLILQEKIYKLLNRILVSGGTYYDWQEATYGEGVARMCEIPMYIGGMSTEIMFEEVISNAETNVGNDFQPLGSLGGKGMNTGKKGGNNIHVRMDEPGYIIGILSITPRISQSQGNDWDRTEIESMDDLHKPELDGIGFQDLMAEQMCWWDTQINQYGEVTTRHAVGKQTAWINYQTAVDKVYGDFAKQEGYSFMVLTRNYEIDDYNGIKDMTTYIDPAKYNYAFAVQDLAAQNFWIQLVFKCTSRRKMGAQQLPNL